MEILKGRLNERIRAAKRDTIRQIVEEQAGEGPSRSFKARTYNFCRNAIVDHRTQLAQNQCREFMNGQVGVFLKFFEISRQDHLARIAEALASTPAVDQDHPNSSGEE